MIKICSEKSCKNIADNNFKQCSKCRERKRQNMADKREKDKINNTCQALRKDDTQCTYKATHGNLCKKHYKLGSTENSGIKQRCSDCHNHSDDINENNKTCGKCRLRRKKNNEKLREKKIVCQGITQKGTHCQYKVVEGKDFCTKHLIMFEKNEYNKKNNIVDCSVNGCQENVFGTNFNTCKICRKKDSDRSKEKRDKIININMTKNDTKICIKCGEEKILSEYLTDSNFKDEINKCKNCRMTQNKADEKRKGRVDKKKSIQNVIYNIKRCAKKRNIDFNLDNKTLLDLLKAPCYYCEYKSDKGFLGSIDRLDSKKSYEKENCISCCINCNISKGSLDITTYIKRCEHICTYRGIINGKLYPELFSDKKPHTYSQYKYKSKRKNIDFEIDKGQFNILQHKPCYLCGKESSITHKNGIDRIDSSKGYISGNMGPCCGECNFMKNKFNLDLFLEKCLLNYQLHGSYAEELSDNTCINMFG